MSWESLPSLSRCCSDIADGGAESVAVGRCGSAGFETEHSRRGNEKRNKTVIRAF